MREGDGGDTYRPIREKERERERQREKEETSNQENPL